MDQSKRPVNYSAVNVRELRGQSGLSRQAVVNRLAECGVSLHSTSLRRIEEGQQAVKIEEAQAFAEIFQVDLADFITKPVNPTIARMDHSIIQYREELKALSGQLLDAVIAWDRMVEAADYDKLSREELRSAKVQSTLALVGQSSALLSHLFQLNDILGEFGVDSEWQDIPQRAVDSLDSDFIKNATKGLFGEGSAGGED